MAPYIVVWTVALLLIVLVFRRLWMMVGRIERLREEERQWQEYLVWVDRNEPWRYDGEFALFEEFIRER